MPDKDDLLDMLDLNGPAAPTPGADLPLQTVKGGSTPPAPSKPPPQPTALQLDRWGLRRGSQTLLASDRLQEMFETSAKGADVKAAENAVADFYGAAFEPDPRLNEACTDQLRLDYLKSLMETPEYKALHEATSLDECAAEIASAHFAEGYCGLKKGKDAEKSPERKGIPGKGKGDSGEMAEEMKLLRAAACALSKATEDVEAMGEAASALGAGAGADPKGYDPRRVAALFKRVRNNPHLKRICELAGKFRRLAQAKQRMKTTHGMDDVVGVEMAGEIGRLLPVELARLADDDLADDTLRRLVERQTMCREHKGTEPVGKGPILVTLDESGSMGGEKIYTAKALSLALAWVARRQRRWCGLIAYSGDSGHRLLALPPSRWDEAALMDWLQEFIGRGSSLDVPVRELPDFYREIGAPVGKTDVVMVTDAICNFDDDIRDPFLAWKKQANVRVTSLVVGYREGGDLLSISDELHLIPAIDVESEAVGKVLSI